MWMIARQSSRNVGDVLFHRSIHNHRIKRPSIVHKRSTDILHDPWFNKGTAFPATERDRLGLRGLLPPKVMTFEQQYERFMVDFKQLEANTTDGADDMNALAKWRILNRLHDRNETLYYHVLIKNIKHFAPIIYTPTIGLVCQRYSGLFRRPRGMYFTADDRGEMMSMIYNWPAEQVDMIVVTDGSRILGLGDLGAQGIGIPIGKLDLYVAAAGINPQRVLPVVIDVGTNNQQLLENPQYMGLQQRRLDGEEYTAIIDEFMEAVYTRWPRVIVQFEDFQNKWAFKLLQRYRNIYRVFNDDVQGTAGVALAGLLGAVRAMGHPMEDIAKQKIVVLGAGSAGLGVVNMVKQAMMRLQDHEKATNQFWILDQDGLITSSRKGLSPDVQQYARETDEHDGLKEGASLLEVVKKVKPDVLLGLSGCGRLFTKEVLEAMKESGCPRPAIFPLSNPTSNAECTAIEAFQYCGPNIIFASGSPFRDVDLGNGKIGHSNQGNNMYFFPGIGLGTLLSGARHVTDGMLHSAAECLAACMSDEHLQEGIIFPPIPRIREITAKVAAAVVKEAVKEDNSEGYRETNARELRQIAEDEGELSAYVEEHMWSPEYSPLVSPHSY
ncbi:unnamed protein product [Sphagnum balticum]